MNDVVDNTIEKLLRGELSVYEVSDKRCRQILVRLVKDEQLRIRIRKKK